MQKKEDFKKLSFEDPNASLDGVNKGIWNVSVVSLLEELTSAIKENRSLNEGSTFEDGLKINLLLMQFSNLQKKENGLIYKNGFFKQKYPYYWSSRWFRFRSLKSFSEKKLIYFY